MLLAQKEQELMAVIDRQRAELARIQQENQEQEERVSVWFESDKKNTAKSDIWLVQTPVTNLSKLF